MNTITNPDLVAFLNDARTDGTADLQRAVDDYVRTAIECATPELRDEYLNNWFDDHAGISLVAYLEDGRITAVHEMSTWEAEACAFDPNTIIVATWSRP